MIGKFAPGLESNYRVLPEDIETVPKNVIKMLREGMVKGDLRGILLPKLSVDQYLPADPKSLNIVLAFFIKGVPEAVLPVKNFIDHCNGVVDVDYGDSETIPNCSIVYAEMNREKLNVQHIHTMVSYMARLANMEPEDFTLTFPNTDDKFPYSPEVIDQYFEMRSREETQKAQERAMADQAKSDQTNDEGVDPGSKPTQIAQEALITRLAGLLG